jgi:uncharacterized membrane protein YphA (DoxX/SURF4 family)
MALRVIDSLALRYEPLILLLGRVCIGSLYLMSGTNHWWDQTLLTHFMTGLPGSVHVWAILAATDLPPNIHPTAVRVSGFCTPSGAGGATGDRRSWSGLRSRSSVAVNVAA